MEALPDSGVVAGIWDLGLGIAGFRAVCDSSVMDLLDWFLLRV
tara:strand:+ start:35 stop:163 length:129 start_codon:yes stop_codon:yes gene_type:complete